MIGRKLANRYQIIEKIGGGGMALVYKARCTLLNRIAAVKVLRPQFAHDEEFVKRFRREAQASASLSHPNIVGVYDVGQEKSNYYIVMEYVDGMTLKEFITSKGFIEPLQALAIASEVADALSHAHENSIIHRDIKPHNILLTQSKKVKVTDFGIAKAITSNTVTAQNTGSIMGSVHYFSPEQAKGNYTGEQSDIYSLGIVMYEMLTGQLPFDGESPISIAIKHIQENVKPIREIKEDIPDDIADIIEKCLQKNKDSRYNSVNELNDDISTWLKLGKVDVEFSLGDNSQHTQVFGVDSGTRVFNKNDDKKDETTKTKKMKKPAIIAALVIGLLAIGILGFFGIRSLLHVPDVTVPNVEGLSLREAIEILKEHGLNYTLAEEVFHASIPSNYVVYQSPIPNNKVKRGREIQLTLSGGPEYVSVPEVLGLDERQARLNIEQVGLEVSFANEHSESIEAGKVTRQTPLGGNLLKGETVTVYISSGPRLVEIPKLVGLTIEQATEALRNINVSVRFVQWEVEQGNAPTGVVVRHSHQNQTEIQPGTSLDLTVKPVAEKSKTLKVNNSAVQENYELKIIVSTDLGGERTFYQEIVDPLEGDITINVKYYGQGEIRVYRDNNLIETVSVN